MIDILNVIVYAGGPSMIASLMAYWSLKAGRKSPARIEKAELAAPKAH
jgi:hypothetical protein